MTDLEFDLFLGPYSPNMDPRRHGYEAGTCYRTSGRPPPQCAGVPAPHKKRPARQRALPDGPMTNTSRTNHDTQ